MSMEETIYSADNALQAGRRLPTNMLALIGEQAVGLGGIKNIAVRIFTCGKKLSAFSCTKKLPADRKGLEAFLLNQR